MHKVFLHTQITCCKKMSIITWPPTMIFFKKNLSFALHNKSCFEIIFVTIDWYIRCAKKIETLFPKKPPKTFKYLGTSGFSLVFF